MSTSELMSLKPEEVAAKLIRGDLTVGVIGLGWMGLPTAILFAKAGAKVIGADNNPAVVDKIAKGNSPIPEPGVEDLIKELTRKGNFKATTSVQQAASQSDVILIIVPVSVDRNKRANYDQVEDASREIGKGIGQGSLVIMESTCGPGVTDRIVKKTLEKYSGFTVDHEIGLAYSPIRAMSGTTLHDLQNYSRVVGAHDQQSLATACAVLSVIVKGSLIRVSDMKTAEASKLFEAVYRDINIAVANEFALLCENAGIDYFEAMRAANSQPYSHLHLPGNGVGGHCLPVYPYLLMHEARNHDVRLRFVNEARKTNDKMPKHTIHLASDGLKAAGKSIKRSKITILGVSFRANAREYQNSPAIELASSLKRRGARVTIFDPKFQASELRDLGFGAEPTLRKALEKADCAIIAVGHEEFRALDPIEISAHLAKSSVLVDCAGIFDADAIEKRGILFRAVGRGTWKR